MPHGTATARLRKSIMFDLAKRCGLAQCFKCAKTIETVDEFTIEHKKPWLYISTELFWSLENIAFSHGKCNKKDRPRMNGENPPGQAWCTGCQGYVDIEAFNIRTPTKTDPYRTVSPKCKECRKQAYAKTKQ